MNKNEKYVLSKEAQKRSLGPANLDTDIFSTNNVVSSTECTGLTPCNVDDEYESTSYSEIYNTHLRPYRQNKQQINKNKQK